MCSSDLIEVKDAEIFNGMLKIALERLIPEHKQPKKIAVKAKTEKQLLTEKKSSKKEEVLID